MAAQVYAIAGGVIGGGSLLAAVWVKFVMKRGLFQPESFQQALED